MNTLEGPGRPAIAPEVAMPQGSEDFSMKAAAAFQDRTSKVAFTNSLDCEKILLKGLNLSEKQLAGLGSQSSAEVWGLCV